MRPLFTHAGARRGSVLLLVIVLLVVLTVLAAVVISFSGTEYRGTRMNTQGAELTSCAEAGRAYLLSRFKLLQVNPEQLELATRLDQPGSVNCPDGMPATPDAKCIRGGHIGENTSTVKGVRLVSASLSGAKKNARDLTNIVARADSLGGRPYQIIVHCQDGQGNESEVEFLVRFGL